MRGTSIIFAKLLCIAALAFATSAFAQNQKIALDAAPTGVAKKQGATRTLKPNLSEAECKQLGGTVNDALISSACASGKSCLTTGQKPTDTHQVCISAK